MKVFRINIKDSSHRTTFYHECDELVIDSIRMANDVFCNNDGIDILDCKNVIVANFQSNSNDDKICLISEDANLFCDNIFISNNRIQSSATAIKFGTSSTGGFKNVNIENRFVFDTYRSTLVLEVMDDGAMEYK